MQHTTMWHIWKMSKPSQKVILTDILSIETVRYAYVFKKLVAISSGDSSPSNIQMNIIPMVPSLRSCMSNQGFPIHLKRSTENDGISALILITVICSLFHVSRNIGQYFNYCVKENCEWFTEVYNKKVASNAGNVLLHNVKYCQKLVKIIIDRSFCYHQCDEIKSFRELRDSDRLSTIRYQYGVVSSTPSWG